MNLIRNLIGLIIAAILLPLFLMAFRYVTEIGFDYDQVNDEIAISQLREQMLISYDLKFTRNMLTFRYKNDDFRLSEVNGMLLLQPGTQIYLNDVDSLHFEKRNRCIYVVYERNGKEYEQVIVSEKGIYIDAFSFCDVSDRDDDLDEE
ncbi:MAG: hypothetical protein II004_05635 [Erysipelotrichaceae bacterium]|nr:hypothetical protein [Erysipelotrichaceae bacterium]MBQ1788394.1 hypothetical protein [Erysipelotrichaceae bacterium]